MLIRALALAVALVVAGGAEASTYRFTFMPSTTTGVWAEIIDDKFVYFDWENPPPVYGTFDIELPRLKRVDLNISWDVFSDEIAFGPPLVSYDVFQYYGFDLAAGGLRLKTDQSGHLLDLSFWVGWAGEVTHFGMTDANYGNLYADEIFSTGSWDVVPVAVPATAPLLMGAVAGLGWLRRRSRNARHVLPIAAA